MHTQIAFTNSNSGGRGPKTSFTKLIIFIKSKPFYYQIFIEEINKAINFQIRNVSKTQTKEIKTTDKEEGK